MSTMNVKFASPTTGEVLDVDLDGQMLARDVVTQLAGADFIKAPSPGREYALVTPRGDTLLPDEPLAGKVRPGEAVQVVQATRGAHS